MVFQSTLPARGATAFRGVRESGRRISIHAPRTGSDRPPRIRFSPSGNFNPRSPHGERPTFALQNRALFVHFNPRSPHGERRKKNPRLNSCPHFNPRSPHGERRGRDNSRRGRHAFQSTLPARGATCADFHRLLHIVISIHAPRTGSDRRCRPRCSARRNFNPRSPHGERRGTSTHMRRREGFQSTLPARGATCTTPSKPTPARYFNPRSPHGERPPAAFASAALPAISIHAPRTGSDLIEPKCHIAPSDFNPRSPHGERQPPRPALAIPTKFQSTLPARGATSGGRPPESATAPFQSTLPARGATRQTVILSSSRVFQSTLPARGATAECPEDFAALPISIHAPRTGSDPRWRTALWTKSPFQSTLPARGATQGVAGAGKRFLFQSTLPARGATTRRRNESACRTHFNPRSPHGERRRRKEYRRFNRRFQSTLPARGAT